MFHCCLRSFHVEYTRSRPITEVKQHRARLVLGWVTAWEYRVSKASHFASDHRTFANIYYQAYITS